MDAPSPRRRPIIVCPLAFEHQAFERAGLGTDFELVCVGPGADQIRNWSRSIGDPDRPVILAGLCGSLDSSRPAGTAWVVDDIVEATGERRWRPTLRRASGPPTTVVSVAAVVTGEPTRRRLAREAQVTIVDLESAAFAAIASHRQWQWAVVRGVSDDLATGMPDNVDGWVKGDGRTHFRMIMRSLLCRPSLLPVVVELRKHSSEALRQAADLIRDLVAPPTPSTDA